MMDYQKLLKRGLDKVPKKEEGSDRFEVPRIRVQKTGSRTILVNVSDVAQALNRKAPHLVKFLLKELGTSGETKGKALEVQGTFNEDHVNKKFEIYIKTFVQCSECGKHDTKLKKDRGFFFMKCEVCGASHTVEKV